MRDTFLLLHFIGIAMAVGTGFANIFLGIAAAKLEPAERGKFMSNTMILIRMGHIGLGLLIVSGLYLITPYWSILSTMPTLIAKLSFVVLLIIMIGITTMRARKALQEKNPAALAKLKPLGMINFFIGLSILILAVLTFH